MDLLRPVVEVEESYEVGTLQMRLARLQGISPTSYVLVDVYDNENEGLVLDREVQSRAEQFTQSNERLADALRASARNVQTVWGPEVVDRNAGEVVSPDGVPVG